MKKIIIIKYIICITLIVSHLFSFQLWLNTRAFPIAPLFDFVPILSSPFDIFYVVLLISALIFIIILPYQRLPLIIYLVLLVLSCLQDQNRWQPWVYQFSLLLFPFIFYKKDKENDLFKILSWVLIFVYFWSGVHKFNPNFLELTYQGMLTQLFGFSQYSFLYKNPQTGYFLAFSEVLMAVFLLFEKTRKAGVLLVIGTHILILLYLSPFGTNRNYIVFPWNLGLALIVFLTFWKMKGSELYKFQTSIFRKTFYVYVVLIGVLPILNFVNLWDHYPSFSLYSGKTQRLYIVISNEANQKLNNKYEDYYVKIPDLDDTKELDISKWAFKELNVPAYPQERVFIKIAQNFCKEHELQSKDIHFLIYDRPLRLGKFRKFRLKNCKTQ